VKVRFGPVWPLQLSVRYSRSISASPRIGRPLMTCGKGPLSHESDSPPPLRLARKRIGGVRTDCKPLANKGFFWVKRGVRRDAVDAGNPVCGWRVLRGEGHEPSGAPSCPRTNTGPRIRQTATRDSDRSRYRRLAGRITVRVIRECVRLGISAEMDRGGGFDQGGRDRMTRSYIRAGPARGIGRLPANGV
jgi:hypothetical protein